MKKVSDFSKQYKVERNTITSYIRRHPELFSGHARRVGRDIMLDDDAVTELEKVYAPKVIVEKVGSEELEEAEQAIKKHLEEIVELRTENITLQDRLRASSERVIELEAKYEVYQQMMEDMQNRLKTAENDRKQAETELSNIKVQQAAEDAEMKHLQSEIERLKHRSLIKRIFNV